MDPLAGIIIFSLVVFGINYLHKYNKLFGEYVHLERKFKCAETAETLYRRRSENIEKTTKAYRDSEVKQLHKLVCDKDRQVDSLRKQVISKANELLQLEELQEEVASLREDREQTAISNNTRCNSLLKEIKELKEKEKCQQVMKNKCKQKKKCSKKNSKKHSENPRKSPSITITKQGEVDIRIDRMETHAHLLT